MPTYVGTQSAVLVVQLQLEAELTETEQLAFVTATEEWIPQADIGHGNALSMPQVDIQSQRMVDNIANGAALAGARRLGAGQNATRVLEIQFRVIAVYSGSDVDFDLYTALSALLQEPDPLFIHLLGNYNDVFLPLRPETTTPPALQSSDSTSSVAVSPGGLSAILIIALTAVGLAIGASYYGVRTYRLATVGEELQSPTTGGPSFDNQTEEVMILEVDETCTPSMEQDVMAQPTAEGLVYDNSNSYGNTAPYDHPVVPILPVTTNPDRLSRDDSFAAIFRGSNQYARSRSNPDPPSNSEVNFPSRRNDPVRVCSQLYYRHVLPSLISHNIKFLLRRLQVKSWPK
jgi:hypothetical protein